MHTRLTSEPTLPRVTDIADFLETFGFPRPDHIELILTLQYLHEAHVARALPTAHCWPLVPRGCRCFEDGLPWLNLEFDSKGLDCHDRHGTFLSPTTQRSPRTAAAIFSAVGT